jgi:hypothetical protein
MKVEKLIELLSKLNPNTEFEIKGDIFDGEYVEIILQIDLEKTPMEENELDILENIFN